MGFNSAFKGLNVDDGQVTPFKSPNNYM